MGTVKEETSRLRDALGRAAEVMERKAAELRRAQDALPPDPDNAPTQQAMRILNLCGFAVVHRERLDEAIACVLVASHQDHETSEEGERIDDLLEYLTVQRHFAD